MEKKTRKELAEIEKIRKKLITIKTKSINPLHCIKVLFIKMFSSFCLVGCCRLDQIFTKY